MTLNTSLRPRAPVACDDMDLVTHNALADALGIPNLTYWGIAGPGGSVPPAMVGEAVAAIRSGQATNVLVVRFLNGRSGDRFGRGETIRAEPHNAYFRPYGLVVPGQVYAMVAHRHMADFGTTYNSWARSPSSAGDEPARTRTRRCGTANSRWTTTSMGAG